MKRILAILFIWERIALYDGFWLEIPSQNVSINFPAGNDSIQPNFTFPEEEIDDEMEIPGWERGKPTDPTRYLKPFENSAGLSADEICREPVVKLVIVVTSAPFEFVSRAYVRSTWASDLPRDVRVGFLLGMGNSTADQEIVLEESAEFEDIIQEEFVDSYYNLTLKSITMLKWFMRQCPTARYLMKVDVDTFLSVKTLLKVMKGFNETGVLKGDLDQGEPHRNVSSKWYVPRYLYEGPVYPEYLRGKGYLMSRDVAEKLYKAALTTAMFHLEDVYVTGVCAEIAGVRPENMPGIMRACPWHMRAVACHPARPKVLVRLWDFEVLDSVSEMYANFTTSTLSAEPSTVYTASAALQQSNDTQNLTQHDRILISERQAIARSSANWSAHSIGIPSYAIVLMVICSSKLNILKNLL